MSDHSKIEWTDATWNPVRGCTKVSEGCRNCYAMTVAARFSGPGQPYEGLARWVGAGGQKHAEWTNQVRLVIELVTVPLHWKKPRRIFVNSMSDLFHDGVDDSFIYWVFAVMYLAHWHQFQVLTKRPARMQQLLADPGVQDRVKIALLDIVYAIGEPPPHCPPFTWPLPNVWLGVSVEDQQTAVERIPLLMQTPAAVRWLSCEPLLGRIDLVLAVTPDDWAWDLVNVDDDVNDVHRPEELIEACEAELDWVNYGNNLVVNPEYREWEEDRRRRAALKTLAAEIDWVVVGGESGRGARPMHPYWARSLRDQCQAAEIPFFFKQWGEYAPKLGEYEPRLVGYLGGRPVEMRTEDFVIRVGKKAAGRDLDGRTWDEYPEPRR
jgi:protein gp37